MGGQRPPWMQQLGQGLAAQQPMPPQGPPQGAPMGGPPQGMPPQGAMGRPPGPPGGAFLRDQDAVIRAALARRGQPIPTGAPQGVPGPAQGAPEPDADERGGPPDGDPDDPRARMGGRPGGGIR